MRDVMPGVPVVKRCGLSNRLPPVLRMRVAPLPLLLAQRLEQQSPPRMQPIEDTQRKIDRSVVRVGEIRPQLLVVGFNRRPVLSARQPNGNVRIHMAVGGM